MLVQFDRPWLLLLLIVLAVGFVWAWRKDIRMKQPKKGIVFTLRALVVVCLVLAMAGMQMGTSTERLSVMYVADRSDSMPEETLLLDWIGQAEQHKGTDEGSGVVSFGRQSSLERMLSPDPVTLQQLTSRVDRNFTNIEQSLQTAFGRLPKDGSGRLVLLTDGRETSGSLLRQGKLLQYAGVPVDVVPVMSEVPQDVAVEQVTVPEQLRSGDRYPLGVRMSSTFETTATLRIYENNREIYSSEIDVQSGENEFVFQSIAGEAGLNRYRVEIYPVGDARSINNVAFAFSRVIGEPHVLVVSGSEQEQGHITAMLEAAALRYTATVPELLSNELSGYTAYDSIILNDVPATSISQQKMEWIEQAVRDFGVGLMMTGGNNSFGLGGYFQTPIERALPVYMDLRGQRQIPSLGLVLVIDRSGSMQGNKLELAKEAALRTMELMREEDTLGVVAFDSTPWWAVEPQKLTDRDEVKSNILSIQANGGTEIYSAVQEAYESLAEIDAQRKHIILLTDGQSATYESYEQLAEQMEEAGITLSSVGIGQGADQALLERIALLGNGRYYFTEDQSTIPAIFSREAVLMTRTYIVDEPFVPQLYQGIDWFHLFQQGVPQVHAYVATTPKETAESVLVSMEPDPVLARWQYGTGKSVAWMSDVNGRWAGDWIRWPAFSSVFSELVQWTFPQFQSSPLSFSSQLEEDEVVLRVQTPAEMYDVQLEAVTSNGESGAKPQVVDFIPVLPGEFEARVRVDEPGVYMTRIDMKRSGGSDDGAARSDDGSGGSDDGAAGSGDGSGGSDDGAAGSGDGSGGSDDGAAGDGSGGSDDEAGDTLLGSWTTGFVIPYSPEYSLAGIMSGESKLKELAEMTGGRLLTLEQADEMYAIDRPTVIDRRDVTRVLLIVALVLWVLDIAARRISVPWAQWLETATRLFSFGKRRRVSMTTAASKHQQVQLDRLQQRKQTVEARNRHIKLHERERAVGSGQGGLTGQQREAQGEALRGEIVDQRAVTRSQKVAKPRKSAESQELSNSRKLAESQELTEPRNTTESQKLTEPRESAGGFAHKPVEGTGAKSADVQTRQKAEEKSKREQGSQEDTLSRLLQAKNRKK